VEVGVDALHMPLQELLDLGLGRGHTVRLSGSLDVVYDVLWDINGNFHLVLLFVAVHVLIIAPKSIEVNHPFDTIELCATAVKGDKRMLYDSVGTIVVIYFEAVDNEIFEAIVGAQA
jgi:hypothetical protein